MELHIRKSKITYRQLAVLAAAVLLLLAAVMIGAGRYAVPCADDFNYSARAHRAWVESGSVFAAVRAAAGTVGDMYRGWQGTFSAAFLMALQPAVFGEGLYVLTPVLMLTALLSGIFCLCLALLGGLFGAKKHLAVLSAACVGILCTQLVPSPVQSFYWYNGSVYYTFFYGVFLLSIALALGLAKRGGIWRMLLLCALCVFLGGGNYVTALSSAILAVGGIALLALLKNRGWRRLLLPTAFLLAAFALSAFAPGNAVRQAQMTDTPGPLEAVLLSFRMGAVYSLRWFSVPLLGVLLFLAPAFFREGKSLGFRFRCPALVSLFSYCLLSAMFCPPLYAMGDVGDKRLVNILYFAYVLLWVLNLFYWMGWLARRKRSPLRVPQGKALAAGVVLLLLGFGAGLFLNSYSSLMALGLLRSGEGQAYYDCAQRRLELLQDPSISRVELEPYPVKPYLLFFDDITGDPEDWRNLSLSEYYGKESVILKGF